MLEWVTACGPMFKGPAERDSQRVLERAERQALFIPVVLENILSKVDLLFLVLCIPGARKVQQQAKKKKKKRERDRESKQEREREREIEIERDGHRDFEGTREGSLCMAPATARPVCWSQVAFQGCVGHVPIRTCVLAIRSMTS